MKKVLSMMMAMAMLMSCLALNTNVRAKTLPELSLDSAATITMEKNGNSDNEKQYAKFTPTKAGCYEFECTTLYKNKAASADEGPGGALSLDLIEDGMQSPQGFAFFFDLGDNKEYIDAMREMGMDVDHINIPKFTAQLEANKTYYLVGFQDGTEDYTTEVTVKEHTHTLVRGKEDKVTVNKNGTSDDFGGIYDSCTDWYCTYLNYTTVYKQIESTTVKNAVYTGKAVKPAVTIKTVDGKKLASKYYTVKYSNNKKIGQGTVKITFRNGYKGTVTKKFKINPKATAVKKVTPGKKQIKATYKKVSNITGYQVQVATNKKFTKNKKTVTVKGAKKTTATVKKLKGGKKYYVRIRTYKTVNGKKYYSSWTKVKSVKTKK